MGQEGMALNEHMIVEHQNGSEMDTNVESEKSSTPYKDCVLSPIGLASNNDKLLEEDEDEDTPNLEDKWYNLEEEEGHPEEAFDPCPNIPISKEEYDELCKPWHASLVVKVLAKKVSYHTIEFKLKRD